MRTETRRCEDATVKGIEIVEYIQQTVMAMIYHYYYHNH